MQDASAPVDPDGVVVVTTVVDDEEVAERLASSAVECGLAACVQVEGPVRSFYRWEGALADDAEWRIVAKTHDSVASDLVRRWVTEHPYDLPEVLVTRVEGGHAPYLRWVGAEVCGPVEEVCGPVEEVCGPVEEVCGPVEEVSGPADGG